MKKGIMIILFTLFITVIFASDNIGSKIITDQLSEKMDSVSDSDLIKINIVMNEQYDSQSLFRATQFLSPTQKREFVVNELRSFSDQNQAKLLNELDVLEKQEKVHSIRALWIANVVNCFANQEAIELLSRRDDIRSIDWDETRNMILDEKVIENSKKEFLKQNSDRENANANNSREITWNVSQVSADDVWSQGYSGSGIVVAVIDTGVNYNHADLSDHLWTDPSYPNHGYDFNGNDNDPMDDHGHGTHCAGTVAGDGTSGSQTGMAPDAQIMCLKILNSSGGGNESDVWDAIQFSVTNGAHIMSMSIGWNHDWYPDRATWRTTLNNALSAGLISSVAAANDGEDLATYPIPDNVATPGDCPPPWLHPDQTLTGSLSDVVCVGATDSSDNIASFSSRGPSTWEGISGFNDYPYNPEMGLIRPDISAPGVSIKSLAHYSNTGYESGWSGTSMATPCIAGVMALMLEKNSTITPAQIDQFLEENVDIPQNPKNGNYGSGRVNALASVNAVPLSGNPICSITNPSNNEVIEIGTNVTITVAASDPSRSVSNVKIYIDNVLKTTDYTSPYTYFWNTSSETLDFHTIKATAVDNELNTTDNEITVRIANPTFTLFEDGFESNTGWALTGEFERGIPTGNGGTNYGNPDPSSAFEGSNVLGVDLTGLGANTYDYEPYLTDREYKATSPTIDCSSHTNVQLDIQRWLNVEQSAYDHAYIDVSNDGFSTYTTIWENSSTITDNSWSQYSYDISSVADNESNVQIRFSLGSSDSGWQYSGWNIDDLVVTGEGSGTPTPIITVTSPNGGEDWNLDTTETITWNSSNTSGTVKIELYLLGTFYNTITSSTDDDGSFTWNIPAGYAESTQYSVRIEDVSDPSTFDSSDAVFSLSEAQFPDITSSPSSFGETLAPDGSTSSSLVIGNAGNANLVYTATLSYSRSFDPNSRSRAYCASTYSNSGSGADDWIANVNFNTIDNSSSYEEPDSYGDYTGISTDIERETTYSLCVTLGFENGTYWTQHARVWFDWNQDEDFNDSGESFYLGIIPEDGIYQVCGDILVPADAVLGSTRMRIIEQYSTDPATPCDPHSTTYGETEDYTVNIISGTPSYSWLTLNGGTSVSDTITPSGADDNITVGFDAAGLENGIYTANINVSSNDPDEPSINIPVTLNISSAPGISVAPGSLPFGDVEVGSSLTLRFTIENTGTATLAGNITTPAGYEVEEVVVVTSRSGQNNLSRQNAVRNRNTISYSIDSGITKTYNLTFSPIAEQSYNGDVIITHNAAVGDELIAVTGAGIVTVPPAAPQNVTITVAGSEIQLQWAEVSGATKYHVWRSADPYGSFTRITPYPAGITGTSYTDTVGSEKYFYYITAE